MSEALSTPLVCQPKQQFPWGREPVRLVRRLLQTVVDAHPEGSEEQDLLLRVLKTRKVLKTADLPEAVKQILRDYGVSTSAARPQ